MKNNTLYKFLFLSITIGCWQNTSAQQTTAFNQFLYQPNLYNPASFGYGTNRSIQLNILHRQQWLGLKDAPSSQVMTASYNLKRMNIGLMIHTDKAHIFSSSKLNFVYAYHLLQTKNTELSLGLNAGFMNQSIALSDRRITNPIDYAYYNTLGKVNKMKFDAGVGALCRQYFGENHLQIGLTLMNLPNAFLNYDEQIIYGAQSNLYFSANYHHTISEIVGISPLLLVRTTMGKYSQGGMNTDIGLSVDFMNQRFSIGGGFRFPQAGFHTNLGIGIDNNQMMRLVFNYEQHPRMGGSFEGGLVFQFGKDMKVREDLTPIKPSKDETDQNRITDGSKVFWNNQKNLSARLSVVDKPTKSQVKIQEQNNTVLWVYSFPDDENEYYLNNRTAYRNLLTHIIENANEAVNPETKPSYLSRIDSVTVYTELLESKEELAFTSDILYRGETDWGSPLNINYILDNQKMNKSIYKGKITNEELAILKSYSLRKKLSKELNIPENRIHIQFRTGVYELKNLRQVAIRIKFLK